MKKAIFLIHGFAGSLYDNEYLMNYLEKDDNFSVFAKTLPGHSILDNYQKCQYQEWIDFIDNSILDLINSGYKSIYVIGHSMGGILAGYACKYKEVKKVVFLNAAYHYLNIENNRINILKNTSYKDYIAILTKALHISIPFFLEFTKLVKQEHSNLNNIYQDILILQSENDQVISSNNGTLIWENVKSQNKYLTYLSEEKHSVFYGNLNNLERKKLIAEYIHMFLKGGLRWKKNYKERI